LANSEELSGKAVARAVMMMKQEATNVAFDDIASLALSCAIGGALSTSSVTSTPRGRPPALEINTPVAYAPALGTQAMLMAEETKIMLTDLETISDPARREWLENR
jgi:hypothetical protein